MIQKNPTFPDNCEEIPMITFFLVKAGRKETSRQAKKRCTSSPGTIPPGVLNSILESCGVDKIA